MPTQLTPEYVPEYWKILGEALYFEAKPPTIMEFETIAEANEWVRSKFFRSLKIRMGFRSTVTIDVEPEPISIPGELSFMIPAFKNKDVIRTLLQYQRGRISEEEITGKNFAHQDVYADRLVIITKEGAEACKQYLEDGGYNGNSDAIPMLGTIHELCEHAFTCAYPSYDFAVQQKMSRGVLIGQGILTSRNPDSDISDMLEWVAAHLAFGYKHSLINMVNAWVLEKYGQDGVAIVSAMRKGVLSMFARNLKKYKSPEDVKENYGNYVGELVMFLSCFLEENVSGEMLRRREYSNGIKPAIDRRIPYTPWTLTPVQFENVQKNARTYLEQHDLRKVEPI